MRIPLRYGKGTASSSASSSASSASKQRKTNHKHSRSTNNNSFALDGDVYDTNTFANNSNSNNTAKMVSTTTAPAATSLTVDKKLPRATVGRKLRKSLGLSKKKTSSMNSSKSNKSRGSSSVRPSIASMGASGSSQKTVDTTACSLSDSHSEEDVVSMSANHNYHEYDTTPPSHPSASVTMSSIDWDALFAPASDDNASKPFGTSVRINTAAVSDTASASNPDRLSFTHNLTRLLQAHQQKVAKKSHRGNCICSSFLIDNPRDQQAMATHLNADFTDTLLEQFRVRDTVEAHIYAAHHLCQQVRDLEAVVQTYSPNPTQTMYVLLEGLQAFLYPRLSVLYFCVHDLQPHEACTIVKWIFEELEPLVLDLVPHAEVLPAWRDDADLLINVYLNQTVRPNVFRIGLQSILQEVLQDNEPREDSGTFFMGTALPQRVAGLYQHALQDVTQALGPWPVVLKQTVVVGNQELLAAISDLELLIGSEWKTLEPPVFCAVINDVTTLANDCSKRNREYNVYSDTLGSNDDTVQDDNNYEEDPMQEDFAELAKYAMSFLCQRIFDDVREKHALSSVGDHTWETNGSCNVVEQTIAGLKVLLTDLRIWLASDKQYVRALKLSFDLLLQTYLESFFVNTMAHGVESALVASEELGRDYLRLVIFFNGSSFEQEEGFYTTQHITKELRILQNMAAILNPENPSAELHEDICATIQRFGQRGASVLHLAGLRQRYNKGPESLQWVRAIDQAKREVLDKSGNNNVCFKSVSSSTSSCPSTATRQNGDVGTTIISVPDLRNSRFLHNIQPCRSPLERSVALATAHHSESTLNLLESARA